MSPRNRIVIGVQRSEAPGMAQTALTIVARANGCDVIFFRARDVDPVEKKINALVYDDGRWSRRLEDYPDVLDNESAFLRTLIGSVMTARRPYTYIAIGGKSEQFELLTKDEYMREYVIPYQIVKSADDVMKFFEEQPSIILKPVFSNQGRGVVKVSRVDDETYEVREDHVAKSLTRAELESFLTEMLTRPFIAQRYIESKTATGIPFDVRIHVQRGAQAKWNITKIYVRLGIMKSITSNIAGGGAIADAEPFLKSLLGAELGTETYNRLKKFGAIFPDRLQQSFGHNIDGLGVDLGIEPDGKFYIFEVNTFCGSKFLYLEHAIQAVNYAKTLAEHPELAYPPHERRS